MNETSQQEIRDILEDQNRFFSTRQTYDLSFRRKQLKHFRKAVRQREGEIAEALRLDLNKSYQEAWLTEISIVLQEIDLHLSRLSQWSRPEKIASPWYMWPSSSRVVAEPLGVALIMAPWNYPFQLLMNPLIGAISAGCTAVIKPSPYAAHTAKVMAELIAATFEPGYIRLLQGGRQTNQILLEERFDLIFFTGSPDMGRVVMQAAAKNLTPVVLELGGKSPCIVDEQANLRIAARRIAWGKTINAGQTCIAPDYVLVHEDLKDDLTSRIAQEIVRMYGQNVQKSPYYPRIINRRAYDRLWERMKDGRVVFGGQADPDELFIHPTILENISPEAPVMQEEIFGPLLPVLPFRHISEALGFVHDREKPLAFYYFGKNKRTKEVLKATSSGGACINDTIMHIVNHRVPFGGVGSSGMGKYHGKASFDAFSNQRGVIWSPTWLDLPFRYPPFNGFSRIKKML